MIYDLVDETEGTGGIQVAGWETYWGKEEDMKIKMKYTYLYTCTVNEMWCFPSMDYINFVDVFQTLYVDVII